MKIIVFLLIFTTAASAQSLVIDPYPNENHYQNNPDVIVQDTLTDCWAFKALTWNKPIDHWSRPTYYLCQQIKQKNTLNQKTANDIALESVLLAFEKTAREWAQDRYFFTEYPHLFGKDSTKHAILINSGWVYEHDIQEKMAKETGLLDILYALALIENPF